MLLKSAASGCFSARIRHFSSPACQASVYISQSHNPYINLAFEDWVYSNLDLTKRRLLFLWRNEPVVVIGRHQNPWLECDIKRLSEKGVKLARRKSGGGAVYHDLGNLNATFFTHRSAYNRHENLALIVKTLRDRWKLDVKHSSRDEIVLNNQFKISGTSSKLGRLTAYHHCTLLLKVDLHTLGDILNPTYTGIRSNATASVRAKVKNLCCIEPTLGFERVSLAIGEQYLANYGDKSISSEAEFINPESESHYPGITAMAEEINCWPWTYGKTPKFQVPFFTTLSCGHVTLDFFSYHGVITQVKVSLNGEQMPPSSLLGRLALHLQGCLFWRSYVCDEVQRFIGSDQLTTQEQGLCLELKHWLQSVL
ncbi:lipoyltransferase 1, mitochondrial isoform X2 [Nematostella vectensis]|uniref:lipoyltransferase 1, mitochondrial isoform X2 n=1 Tax=Nematostella vectensis TaxID=45351 RepID=UPI002077017D|nr:lipoyltransferase 1, mitochondrial isoform X2 [Nematostella vectensis]